MTRSPFSTGTWKTCQLASGATSGSYRRILTLTVRCSATSGLRRGALLDDGHQYFRSMGS